MSSISRRRAISILAATTSSLLVGCGQRPLKTAGWNGTLLGAEASLRIYHEDAHLAKELVDLAVAEAARLERIFSLYLPHSDLKSLNRLGFMAAPTHELVELLLRCRSLWERTSGAFDPTVQPLWSAYWQAFAATAAPPAAKLLGEKLALVGFHRVAISEQRVELAEAEAGLTLNGIAQGYVTDRIVTLLRRGGVDRAVVDMGESRAIGAAPDGHGWRVGIADPKDPMRILRTMQVTDRAVATSAQSGFSFDGKGRYGHIIDPRTGMTPQRYQSVTVVAPDATQADALSTAFTLMPEAEIETTLRRFAATEAFLLRTNGEWLHLGGRATPGA